MVNVSTFHYFRPAPSTLPPILLLELYPSLSLSLVHDSLLWLDISRSCPRLRIPSSTATLRSIQFPGKQLSSHRCASDPKQPLHHSFVPSRTALLSPSAKIYRSITGIGCQSRIPAIGEEQAYCFIRRRSEDLTGSAISETRRSGSSTGSMTLASPPGRSVS